jgi:hypothetical protein
MANNDNAANVKIEGEMHLVITGRVAPQYIEHSGNSQIISMIEIGTSNISKAVSSAGKDLDNIGMVSLDQLFCPYMIGIDWATHELLPHWEEPTSTDVNATSLNPFNPSKTMVDAAKFYAEGPNVALYNSIEIINGEQIGSGDFSQYKNIYPNGGLELNSVKGVGFKAPIIITGWGYDIDGKPVPADSEDPDAFASDAFRNPVKWKSGPLDVRWDDEKKVWTSVGGGTPSILFEIIRVLRGAGLNCNAMECEILNSSCGSGVSVGDIVTVYDEMGCVFNAPEHLLISRRGYAIKMSNFTYRIQDPLIFEVGTEDIAAPEGSCRWSAQNLCCVEERI